MWPEGPQDGSDGLQQACRQTLKDLFVHTASKNGFVLIWDIQLQEWKMKTKQLINPFSLIRPDADGLH